MKVLVTGGGGFIGSNLARTLVQRGDEVRILDNFSTGNRTNLADSPTSSRSSRENCGATSVYTPPRAEVLGWEAWVSLEACLQRPAEDFFSRSSGEK